MIFKQQVQIRIYGCLTRLDVLRLIQLENV